MGYSGDANERGSTNPVEVSTMALSDLSGWAGTACGASGKPETPAACGTACGAGDK